MTVTQQQITSLAAWVISWGESKRNEGFHAGAKYAGLDLEVGALEPTPGARDRSVFDIVVQKFDELRQGLESEGDEAMAERRTIRTLEELRALPRFAVVLEDQYESAYQKVDSSEMSSWVGDGRFYDDVQIDLPVTVIYEGRVR